MKSIMTILIILSIMFMMSFNPLFLGFILILTTAMVAMFTGFMNKSFWFSYILLIIYMGSMLILFMYVISMIYNKNMTFNIKLSIVFTLTLISLTTEFKLSKTTETMSLLNLDMSENSFNLIKLYDFPNNVMNMLMISYLFLLMVIIVKMINFSLGPLRMK